MQHVFGIIGRFWVIISFGFVKEQWEWGFLGELVDACERCCFFEEDNQGSDALFCAEDGGEPYVCGYFA